MYCRIVIYIYNCGQNACDTYENILQSFLLKIGVTYLADIFLAVILIPAQSIFKKNIKLEITILTNNPILEIKNITKIMPNVTN